jgi:hypothetical protein
MPYPHTPTHVFDLVELSAERFYFARQIGIALWMSDGMLPAVTFQDLPNNLQNIFIAKGHDMLLAMEALGIKAE